MLHNLIQPAPVSDAALQVHVQRNPRCLLPSSLLCVLHVSSYDHDHTFSLLLAGFDWIGAVAFPDRLLSTEYHRPPRMQRTNPPIWSPERVVWKTKWARMIATALLTTAATVTVVDEARENTLHKQYENHTKTNANTPEIMKQKC
jgi:hypothetical protein